MLRFFQRLKYFFSPFSVAFSLNELELRIIRFEKAFIG